MSSSKTTVYLDTADYQRLKALARAEGRTTAALVREAVAEYAMRRAGRKRPRSLSVARSGRGDLSEQAESLLAGMPRDEE
jgi:predicted transcriptional regulator